MSPVQASCPSCGGPVKFSVPGVLVTICDYCQSVVGRGDRELEDLGKIADVMETGSPLDLWLQGRYRGVPFQLTGRVQYSHPGGGVWDEWYAAFSDGRWGWLAEAQGRFYMTFRQYPTPDVPDFNSLRLDQEVSVDTSKVPVVVAEKNTAQVSAGRGEIPFRLVPGKEHPFADLSGPESKFATIEYSGSTPVVFVGQEVSLDDLGIPPVARRRESGGRDWEARSVPTRQLNCPNCGGALTLHAPDDSERVGCPSCGSLLDVQEGNLRLLQSLRPPEIKPLLPLGTTGTLAGVTWTVIGFLGRGVTIAGVDYCWSEYLLYEPREGFCWLVHSDNHWTRVESVPPGDVRLMGQVAVYQGRTYSLFQKATARVELVLGEFYWKVQAGDRVRAQDFVNPPRILSQEVDAEQGSGEINWSHGYYHEPGTIEKAFGVRPLPRPSTIAPNQPFPHKATYIYAVGLLALAACVGLLVSVMSPARTVMSEKFSLPAVKAKRSNVTSNSFQLRGGENVCITLKGESSTWVYVQGRLGKKGSPETQSFSILSENKEHSSVYLSAPARGEYVMHLDFSTHAATQPIQAMIYVQQGVAHSFPCVVVFLILLAFPVGVGLYHAYFENQRWEDSNVR